MRQTYRLCMTLALVLSSTALIAQEQGETAPVDSQYVFDHYSRRVEQFSGLSGRIKKPIVFLGNSITEAGRWNDILPGEPVVNRGISGDISFGVLARIDSIIELKPRKVFLLIGVNDLKRGIPISYIIKNYKAIVDRLRDGSPRTKIYLQSVLPVNPEVLIEPFKQVRNADILTLNKALKALTADKHLQYVDLHAVFADEHGNLKKALTPDGIHLHLTAYPLWVSFLQENNYLK